MQKSSLSAVEVEQQELPYEICALSDSENSDKYMEIIPEGTDGAEECDTSEKMLTLIGQSPSRWRGNKAHQFL